MDAAPQTRRFMEQLNKFDALATPVNDIETLLADPHVRDRGIIVTNVWVNCGHACYRPKKVCLLP